MALRIIATDASEIRQGIWSFDMPPHQVRHFGITSHAIGAKSVLIFKACEYDKVKQQLHFDIEDVVPINIGTTSSVIGLTSNVDGDSPLNPLPATAYTPAIAGPGDREFLRLAKAELSQEAAKTAERLLIAIRERSSGDLKRGQSRNFSETPDNFWYVIVQPRVDELSITVRGSVKHFEPVAELETRDDRGNTRFKVRGPDDIPAALKLIFHAIRKR
jgi:hypothetical protein